MAETKQQQYVPYGDSIETKQPDEEKVFDDLAAAMHRIAEKIGDRVRHIARPVHAKSHGLLKAELEVYADLPTAYRQGLFASAGRYPVIMRFSTNPGDMLPDSISTPRGLALKIIGPGNLPMVEGHEGEVTQNFAFVNAKTFQVPDAKAFLKQVEVLEKHATDSEG